MRQGLAHLAAGTIAAMVAQRMVPVPFLLSQWTG